MYDYFARRDPSARFVERWLTLCGSGGSVEVKYAPLAERRANLAVSDVVNLSTPLAQSVARHVAALGALKSVDIAGLGVSLASAALPDRVRFRLLADVRQAEASGQRVRLWIKASHASVAGWPWEYLWVSELGDPGFLALHPACSIVRAAPRYHVPLGVDHLEPPPDWSIVRASHPPDAGDDLPTQPGEVLRRSGDALEVLIVWADPADEKFPATGADVQVNTVISVLRALARRGLRLRVLWPFRRTQNPLEAATRNNLARSLREAPAHIVYVVTHGQFDEQKKQGYIVLEKEDQSGHDEVLADELSALFGPRSNTHVIFFDSCESGSRGASGTGRSVAEALAAPGRVVIGMQFPWPAAACLPFWYVFFTVLTVPQPVDECLFAARDWLYRVDSSLGDWGCPVLYRSTRLITRAEPQARVRGAAAEPPPAQPKLLRLLEQAISEAKNIGRLDEILHGLLGLHDRLVTSLRDVLVRPVSEIGGGLSAILEDFDPLYVITAGEEGESKLIESSPIWFTHLLSPPHEIAWTGHTGQGPWHLHVWTIDGTDILRLDLKSASVNLPPVRRDAIPRDVLVRWEIRRTDGSESDNVLVRGAFRVLPAGEANLATVRLGELRGLAGELDRELAIAGCYFSFGLFDSLTRHLRDLERRFKDGADGFVVQRAFASVYAAIHRSLTGNLMLGDPEGLWAAELARRRVEAAYRALGLHMQLREG